MVLMATEMPGDVMSLRAAAREYSTENIERLGIPATLGITYAILRGWIRRGLLRSWERDNRVFVSRAEIEQLIQPKPR